MNQRRFYKPMLVAVALLMLGLVFFVQRELNQERTRLKLTRLEALENMPPALAFTTVALGGFRGLIANGLWIRLSDLQLEEKFFEMVQLADWITKLQPHFTAVWVHQAWNMAYNISVKFPDATDRWLWVQRGFELLRDEGLKYNPNETLIYRELAWIFQHKMGANLDNAHMYYKQQWARKMNDIFGVNPDWEELIHPQTDAARARAKLLRETYKIDPRLAKLVDEEYGPLEWRLPETHAIYWGYLGLQKAKQDQLITLRRVIYQSMQLVHQRGRLIENAVDGYFQFGPNIDSIPKANAVYEQMLVDDPAFSDNIRNAHGNFFKQAVFDLYIHNREQLAAQWFEYFKHKYPIYTRATPDMDSYMLERFAELVDSGGKDKVQAQIEGMLLQYFVDTAIGEHDRATGLYRLAQKVYAAYVKRVERAEGDRVELPPWDTLRVLVRDRILNAPPDVGASPQLRMQLVTAFNLPLTNRPPWLAGVTNANTVVALTNRLSRADPGRHNMSPPPIDLTPARVRNQKAGEQFLAHNRAKPGVITLPSGLQYKVLRSGKGRTVGLSDKVLVHYTGRLIGGGIFDGSREKGKPAEFGVTGVIKGWTEALQLMKGGDHWELYIPGYLAYAEAGGGFGHAIGPNETLVFEVEILKVSSQ